MLQPNIIAERLAHMDTFAKTAQGEAFETHTAYCDTLSNEVVDDVAWYNPFSSANQDSNQTRCHDNIDTASVINEVAGISNRLALAETEEDQVKALEKFYELLYRLEKNGRAPQAVKGWRAYEKTLNKEVAAELGTSEEYEKDKNRKNKLFKGKAFSLAGGLALGLIVGILTGGNNATKTTNS